MITLFCNRITWFWIGLIATFVGLLGFLFYEMREEPIDVRIALFAPITGEYTRKGNEHLRAALLAIERFPDEIEHLRVRSKYWGPEDERPSAEMIRAFYDRLQVGLVAFDSSSNPFDAVGRLLEEHEREGLLGVVGLHLSGDTKALLDRFSRSSDSPPIMVSCSTASAATLKGVDPREDEGQSVNRSDGSRGPLGVRYCVSNKEIAAGMKARALSAQARILDSLPEAAGLDAFQILVVDSGTLYSADLAKELAHQLGESPVGVRFARKQYHKSSGLQIPSDEDRGGHERGGVGGEWGKWDYLTIMYCGSSRDAISCIEELTDQVESVYPDRQLLEIIGSDGLYTRDFYIQQSKLDRDRSPGRARTGWTPRVSVVSLFPEFGEEVAPALIELAEYRSLYADRYDESPDGFGYFTYLATLDLLFAATLMQSPPAAEVTSAMAASLDGSETLEWLRRHHGLERLTDDQLYECAPRMLRLTVSELSELPAVIAPSMNSAQESYR